MTRLEGSRVALRTATRDDAPHFVRWAAEPEFAWQQWGRDAGRFVDAAAALRGFIDRFVPPQAELFVIEHEGRPIGFANYRDLQPKARSAEIGIGIGESALWGKGLGREAAALLLGHLTGALGLHRVTLHVMSYNDRAISSYKACGFVVEGVLKDAVMTDRGHWADSVAMAYVVGRQRPSFDPRPVTLAGRHVRLEPLREEHAAELFAAASEPDIWRYLPKPPPTSLDDSRALIREALDQQVLGTQVPWLVRRASDGKVLGSTRFLNIDRADRGLEIGWTFLSADGRRTSANTEAKYLQLRHAFEDLGALRVALVTDARNDRSRQAIQRIGATAEGVLRKDRILPDGHVRSTVVFSIVDDEWEDVKRELEARLAAPLTRPEGPVTRPEGPVTRPEGPAAAPERVIS